MKNTSCLLLWCITCTLYMLFFPTQGVRWGLFRQFVLIFSTWCMVEKVLWEVHSVFFLLLYRTMRVTECILPEGELKVVCLWNWPKQELREKNWSAMEALSATESMLQGKLSKTVKVRHPTSVYFSLVPIWIDPVIFLFPPSSITKLHTHLPPSHTSSCLALKFWIGCMLNRHC